MASETFRIPSNIPLEYAHAVQETVNAMEDHIEARGDGYVKIRNLFFL